MARSLLVCKVKARSRRCFTALHVKSGSNRFNGSSPCGVASCASSRLAPPATKNPPTPIAPLPEPGQALTFEQSCVSPRNCPFFALNGGDILGFCKDRGRGRSLLTCEPASFHIFPKKENRRRRVRTYGVADQMCGRREGWGLFDHPAIRGIVPVHRAGCSLTNSNRKTRFSGSWSRGGCPCPG